MSEESTLINQNKKIISLLETLQEYERAQALLQSVMIDGFLELARSRRLSSGIVCPELITSPDLETRKLFKPNDTFGSNPNKPFVSGVSESVMQNIQTEFESALKNVVNVVSIVGQINEKVSDLKKDFDLTCE